jgi:hypothetical protein
MGWLIEQYRDHNDNSLDEQEQEQNILTLQELHQDRNYNNIVFELSKPLVNKTRIGVVVRGGVVP